MSHGTLKTNDLLGHKFLWTRAYHIKMHGGLSIGIMHIDEEKHITRSQSPGRGKRYSL